MTGRRAKASKQQPATILAGEQLLFVHDHQVQQRDQRRRHPTTGQLITVQTYRLVCSCGWSSSWRDDRRALRRLGAAHGVTGQLSIVHP